MTKFRQEASDWLTTLGSSNRTEQWYVLVDVIDVSHVTVELRRRWNAVALRWSVHTAQPYTPAMSLCAARRLGTFCVYRLTRRSNVELPYSNVASRLAYRWCRFLWSSALSRVHTSNSVEATFDFVERIVRVVAFDSVALTLLLVWTGL